jgi:signal transduction histidine kinase
MGCMTSARLLAAGAVGAVVLSVLLAGRSVTVPAWTLPAAALLPLGLYGWAARLRGAYDRQSGERGWLLERERERAALAAIESERARIAAEMHDIVSHNVSVMVIQAGAARQRAAGPGTSDGLVQALRAVESCGRDAMAELRHLLGLLTPSGDGDELTVPQPSMGRLGTLVDKISFAGLPVEVSVAGTPRPLPPALDATAFRVVQEALTNALKHASPGARAEVLVRYTDRNLRLEVLNTGPSVLTGSPPPPKQETNGRGLIGLRERVAVHGGDLDARRRLGGGYRIRARIPLERP